LFLKHAAVIQATGEHSVHTSLTGTIRDQLGEFGIGSNPDFLVGGRTAASAECREGSPLVEQRNSEFDSLLVEWSHG
jgi:hypothetical protein